MSNLGHRDYAPLDHHGPIDRIMGSATSYADLSLPAESRLESGRHDQRSTSAEHGSSLLNRRAKQFGWLAGGFGRTSDGPPAILLSMRRRRDGDAAVMNGHTAHFQEQFALASQ
jgi:hypothetical protein